MTLSFIIVNYQSEKYLAKCISLIREKIFGVDYEIILVNNSSHELKAELINGTKTLKNEKNIGFGAACNMGAREAQGKILCFLNPDTEIVSEKIENLLKEFEKKEKLAVVGPKLIGESGKTQQWIAGKEITLLSILLNNLGYKRDKAVWESQKPVSCAWVSGAAMFARKDIFQKIGGFDEKFFMYFEDIDFCRRARQAGYAVIYFPQFMVKHLGGKSFLDKKEQKRYYRKSQWRYFTNSLLK